MGHNWEYKVQLQSNYYNLIQKKYPSRQRSLLIEIQACRAQMPTNMLDACWASSPIPKAENCLICPLDKGTKLALLISSSSLIFSCTWDLTEGGFIWPQMWLGEQQQNDKVHLFTSNLQNQIFRTPFTELPDTTWRCALFLKHKICFEFVWKFRSAIRRCSGLQRLMEPEPDTWPGQMSKFTWPAWAGRSGYLMVKKSEHLRGSETAADWFRGECTMGEFGIFPFAEARESD